MNDRRAVAVSVVSPGDAPAALLAELRETLSAERRPLIGFATGRTFANFLAGLARAIASGGLPVDAFLATHLDEYEGFPPDRRGGMAHELFTACPPLAALHARSAFAPVPCVAEAAAIGLHEQRLAAMGGVALQFVGIGRNGHVAFHEPGVPLDVGFHVATLSATTRDDARPRFAPAEPPARAITSGVATILAASRVVLCAFGAAKAPAVRAMLVEPIAAACPASALRAHPRLRVLLDRDAASLLPKEFL